VTEGMLTPLGGSCDLLGDEHLQIGINVDECGLDVSFVRWGARGCFQESLNQQIKAKAPRWQGNCFGNAQHKQIFGISI